MLKLKHIIVEAVVFLALACTIGLAFNVGRNDGLVLSRNYFPPIDVQDSPGDSKSEVNALATRPPAQAPARPETVQKPLEHGFQTVTLQQAHDYFEQADSSIVFIDARDDDGFRCHIPTAVQFNYYFPDRYRQGVLDAAEQAEVVIIYCNGGTCEDSIRSADYLTTHAPGFQAPFRMEQVYVFEGGIQEWFKAEYPLEPESCKP